MRFVARILKEWCLAKRLGEPLAFSHAEGEYETCGVRCGRVKLTFCVCVALRFLRLFSFAARNVRKEWRGLVARGDIRRLRESRELAVVVAHKNFNRRARTGRSTGIEPARCRRRRVLRRRRGRDASDANRHIA